MNDAIKTYHVHAGDNPKPTSNVGFQTQEKLERNPKDFRRI